jgi:hypothetical protein
MTSTSATGTEPRIAMARVWFAALLAATLMACTTGRSSPEQAGATYRQHRDYESLEIIHEHMAQGMPSAEVERLLGEPDYCPTGGLCYYSSARKVAAEHRAGEVSLGLVVDYRDDRGAVTKTLQKHRLGPIDE